jgi:hypothetical protein
VAECVSWWCGSLSTLKGQTVQQFINFVPVFRKRVQCDRFTITHYSSATRQCSYNVTLRHVREIIVAVEK